MHSNDPITLLQRYPGSHASSSSSHSFISIKGIKLGKNQNVVENLSVLTNEFKSKITSFNKMIKPWHDLAVES